MQYVFPISKTKHYRFPTHVNDLVIDRSESATSEVFVVVLEPGEAPPPHKHDDTEQVFYVMDGEGILTVDETGEEYEVHKADVVRIPPSTLHSIRCTGGKTLKYLSIDCFVEGRPKAELTWDSHVKVMCSQNGWNYESVAG